MAFGVAGAGLCGAGQPDFARSAKVVALSAGSPVVPVRTTLAVRAGEALCGRGCSTGDAGGVLKTAGGEGAVAFFRSSS